VKSKVKREVTRVSRRILLIDKFVNNELEVSKFYSGVREIEAKI